MRIVWFCLIVLFALLGLVFGALNGEDLGIDPADGRQASR